MLKDLNDNQRIQRRPDPQIDNFGEEYMSSQKYQHYNTKQMKLSPNQVKYNTFNYEYKTIHPNHQLRATHLIR